MGRLVYPDLHAGGIDLDDRVLAHLRIVVMNKLRRAESFMLTVPGSDGMGPRSIWLSPSVPLVFHFFGGREPALDADAIERMMIEASSPNGLVLDRRALG
jgi:hypothetical protein